MSAHVYDTTINSMEPLEQDLHSVQLNNTEKDSNLTNITNDVDEDPAVQIVCRNDHKYFRLEDNIKNINKPTELYSEGELS